MRATLNSPALAAIIATRIAQIERHGHSAAADDATGAAALAHMARQKLLKLLQTTLRRADAEAQAVGDQLMTRPECLSASDITTTKRRLATAAALTWAAMDVLDRLATSNLSQPANTGDYHG